MIQRTAQAIPLERSTRQQASSAALLEYNTGQRNIDGRSVKTSALVNAVFKNTTKR